MQPIRIPQNTRNAILVMNLIVAYFEGNNGKYFSSSLLMFPEGEKKPISSGLIYQDLGLDATKDCKYQMLVK